MIMRMSNGESFLHRPKASEGPRVLNEGPEKKRLPEALDNEGVLFSYGYLLDQPKLRELLNTRRPNFSILETTDIDEAKKLATHPDAVVILRNVRMEGVRVSVVTAGELHELRSLGEGSSEPNGAHRRLRSGVDQPNHLERRHRLDQDFGQPHFILGGNTERRPLTSRGDSSFHDLIPSVSEQERAPRLDVVDEPAPVDIDEFCSTASEREDGSPANSAESAHRRVHAARDDPAGPLEQLVRPAHRSILPRPNRCYGVG